MKAPVAQRGDAILRRLPAGGTTRTIRVAEIGVLDGRLSQHILRGSDCHLTMVDSWLPGDQQPERYKQTRDAHSDHTPSEMHGIRTLAMRVAAGYADRTTVLEMDSVAAAAKTKNGSLDLVFLDADHSVEGLRRDVAAWLPKVRKGGWIGGHDYANTDTRFAFGVDQVVDEFVAQNDWASLELDDNFTWFVRVPS